VGGASSAEFTPSNHDLLSKDSMKIMLLSSAWKTIFPPPLSQDLPVLISILGLIGLVTFATASAEKLAKSGIRKVMGAGDSEYITFVRKAISFGKLVMIGFLTRRNFRSLGVGDEFSWLERFCL